MDYKAQIEAYWNDPKQKEQLVDLISRLVAVRSVKEEAAPNAPFGPGPAKCLDLALDLCGELGFATENVDYYVGTAVLYSSESIKSLALGKSRVDDSHTASGS